MSETAERVVPPRPRAATSPGSRVVSPDGSRSAWWDGRPVAPENALVFPGEHCTGEPLFRATFVLADDPEHAARLAFQLGGTVEPASLGAGGSTGPDADRLYYCAMPVGRHERRSS